MQLPITRDARTIEPQVRAGTPAEPAPTERQAAESTAAEPTTAEETRYRTHRRFDRAARLFTEPGLHTLMAARVLVVGVGGVGSFTAEALARSAVGNLVLVDFDRVCVTNTNRQLHAMQGTIGKRKVEVMAQRLELVHPTGRFEALPVFYNAETSSEILSGRVDFVVDAIDNLTAKAHLIATCIARGIPIVSSMGAAARLDPTAIQVADLSDTYKDPFASALRKVLRQEHGLPIERGRATGVQAVFSTEEPIPPSSPSYDEGVGFRCVCPGGKNGLHDCDRRARIDGTAAFVTGAFGLAAAGVVVRFLIAKAAPPASGTVSDSPRL
jgi:tRNA A37 threonylcarbamoyladenosine dehydratase